MLFYAARIVRLIQRWPIPTLVVLTASQRPRMISSSGSFQRCATSSGQKRRCGRLIVEAVARSLLNRAQWAGVVFTHHPEVHAPEKRCADARAQRPPQTIVVSADEAHRSQYGFGAGKVNEKTGAMTYGFASNLRDCPAQPPPLSCFTGRRSSRPTPNTRRRCSAIYNLHLRHIQRAVAPIGPPCRSLREPHLQALPERRRVACVLMRIEEINRRRRANSKEKLKNKWAALEALVAIPSASALRAPIW